MLLSPRAIKLLNSTEKTSSRMLCVTFIGKSCVTIISSDNPTNASDETDITTFYNGLSSQTTF